MITFISEDFSQMNMRVLILAAIVLSMAAFAQTLPITPGLADEESGVFQVRYLTLQYGDGVLNFTNAGTLAGTDPAGTICVNVYAFDPAEEMISCCACKVTPNGLSSISARNDIMQNTLTPGTPQSITVKLLASAAGGANCNAATQVTATNLVRGMKAWATTLHSLSIQGSPAPPPLTGLTETEFSKAELSASEFNKLTSYCNFIQLVGSGYGQCKSCSSRVGAQGGTMY
jgi:hypothetical protein